MPSRESPPAKRQLLAACVGSIVESFDWLIYAVLAPYFAGAMFPGDDPVAQLLASYLVFAVGFLVRPVGAVVMGRLTDRRGRRYSLVVSVALISVSSLIIALTPDAGAIGIFAAVIVVIARLVQGLAMSGEQTAAGTYVVETAPPDRRFLYGALLSSANYVGQLLALATLAVLLGVLGSEGLESGAWRIGFAVCAVLGLVALWIRRAAPESDTYLEQVAEQRQAAQLPLLRAHWRQAVAVFLLIVPATMGLYFVTAYLPVFLDDAGVADKADISRYLPLLMIYLIAVIALAGRLADRFGGLRVLRAGLVVLVVTTAPVILALQSGALPVIPGSLLYLTVLGVITAPIGIITPQLFPPQIRAVGAGLPSMIGVALFGGTFALVATALSAAGHAGLLPWYVTLGSVLGLTGGLLVRQGDLYDARHSAQPDAVPA
ncbi:MFS transporter [Cryptosporangium aurantiacum]|uniref:MFS transporter n=1 Tax=Cryptosporangium aurantiacum TaxID=134849 RepID=UPI000932496B|nr:MFS transporter [Cryptosporangium aurantiacum]